MVNRTKKDLEAELGSIKQVMSDAVENPLDVVQEYIGGAGIENVEAMFYLYRVVDAGKSPDAFLFKCKPEDYDPEALGNTYGSGIYRLKLYVKDDEHPHGVLRAAPKFSVEMPPGFVPAGLRKEPEQPAQAAPALTVEQIALAVAAALKSSQPAPQSRAEMIEEMRLMADLFRPAQTTPAYAPPPPADPFEQVTKTLAMIKALREEMPEAGGKDNEPSAMKIIAEGIETVKGFLPPRAEQPPMLPPQALLNPATAPTTAQQPATQEDENVLLLKMYLGIACQMARQGKPVDSAATSVYENADEETLAMIIEGKTPQGVDWWTELQSIKPEVQSYGPWFAALRAKIIEYAQEDARADEQANAGDTASQVAP